MARLAQLTRHRDVPIPILVQRSMQHLGENLCGALGLAIFPIHPDNVYVHRGTSRSQSHVQEETLRGVVGGYDQRSDSSRGSKASPWSRHAASARPPTATKEDGGASHDGHDPAPERDGLETADGG